MSAETVRDELAEVIVSADDTIDLRYGRHVADVILTSDWLAEYVATKQAEALREYRDALAANESAENWAERSDYLHDITDWFNEIRADRIANMRAVTP